jgi:hypothetical protein
MRDRFSKSYIRPAWNVVYHLMVMMLMPMNLMGIRYYKKKFFPNSILHISYMVHVPYFLTRTLRKHGIKADYMAIGTSPLWNQSDYQIKFSPWPFLRPFQEFRIFWNIVSRYEIIHSHFMLALTYSAWEWPILKRMGRKIVIHYRGCEIRDPEKVIKTNPEFSICEGCAYENKPCQQPVILRRRAMAQKYGDLFFVTTPDLKRFAPYAIHLPFFAPDIDMQSFKRIPYESERKNGFKIVHVSNQPGIEGTKYIQKAIDHLIQKGYKINFIFLQGVPFEKVLRELASADMAVGKLKMGYYANAQIESMLMGVPTITHISPEYMVPDLQNSGFIFSNLRGLEETIE